MLSILFALIFYFLPTVIAMARDHKNSVPIFFANLFFGWTGIGWLIVFVWSFTN